MSVRGNAKSNRHRRQLSGSGGERSAGGFRQEATPWEASGATSGGGSKKGLNEDLRENILEPENLRQAYRQVKANDGAAGVDGMTVETFAGHARAHWPVIAAKLKDGSYQPGAVRGVGIPKPNGGERRLGIPTGQDRLIQQAVAQVPTPMFDPQFSAHSDGYRPGRSAQEAVRAAQEHIRGGHTWIVEVDIGAFFDEMDQDIPMRQVSAKVNDKRVLRLLGDSLRSPVQLDGRMEKTHASNTPGRTPESAVSQHLSG